MFGFTTFFFSGFGLLLHLSLCLGLTNSFGVLPNHVRADEDVVALDEAITNPVALELHHRRFHPHPRRRDLTQFGGDPLYPVNFVPSVPPSRYIWPDGDR